MSSLTTERQIVKAQRVSISDESITVDLSDGRTVVVPIGWFPRIMHGSAEERNNWRLIGDGEGIRWSDLDEDISVGNLILGNPSGESQRSLKQWLDKRKTN